MKVLPCYGLSFLSRWFACPDPVFDGVVESVIDQIRVKWVSMEVTDVSRDVTDLLELRFTVKAQL